MPLSGSFTQSFQQLVLDALGQRTVFDPAIDGLKLALFTADPGEGASTSNEISGGGYTRQSVVLGDATNNASNHGEIANTAAISFAASGASWSGITHAGLFKSKSFTRTIPSAASAYTKLNIPASHCALSATRTVTDSTIDANSDTVLNVTNTAGTYNGTDLLGNSIYFVRVKTGPLAGMCFEVAGDGTNTIELQNHYKFPAEEINGQQIEIREKPTVSQFFGTPSTYVTGNASETLSSGLIAGSSSVADELRIVNSSQSHVSLYPSHAPAFAGGDGWRVSGSTDYNATRLFPMEVIAQWDQTNATETDDYLILRNSADSSVETSRGGSSGTYTITSQLSTTDEMLARFQFEDSGGNAQTLNVADGSSLDVAIGDLKLTLN